MRIFRRFHKILFFQFFGAKRILFTEPRDCDDTYMQIHESASDKARLTAYRSIDLSLKRERSVDITF